MNKSVIGTEAYTFVELFMVYLYTASPPSFCRFYIYFILFFLQNAALFKFGSLLLLFFCDMQEIQNLQINCFHKGYNIVLIP